MDCLKLRRVVSLTRRLGPGQMSSLASSERQDSFSSKLLSGESKERCVAKLRQMKPIRPASASVSVQHRAAVLGGSG